MVRPSIWMAYDRHGMGAYRFVGHDGVDLACSETGSGRPLILLHGFMGAGSHWLEQGKVDAAPRAAGRLIVC
jgi:pimeloyl-ACP methyl ester carboxylesterase